jgi:Capsule assembly protein Wzi
MKFFFVLTFLLFLNNLTTAQIETIPTDHPVYPFLKKLQVEGILKNYNDVVLPKSKKEIQNYILQIDSSRSLLSETDREFLDRMFEHLSLSNHESVILENFPSKLSEKILNDKERHLYNFSDSMVTFTMDPIFDYKFIHSDYYSANADLFNFGGRIYGSYNNWLGFFLQGSNGLVFNNKNVAEIDSRVRHSYTFNNTKINFFDGTSGYLRLQKGIVSAELGRERLLWGQDYINRMVLSDNPQLFDFIRFDISYKSLTYNFIHGWLVQPTTFTYVDSIVGYLKSKSPKYIALSRVGFMPNNSLSLGVSQFIIYSDRPFEAAYLNPFLFWESAQRSMNDLDNSFLSFDGRFLIMNGMELSGNIIFDDIKFDVLAKGEFAKINNRSAWQVGMMLTNPILFRDLDIKIEYLQIRPYTFSHPGGGEALTYTNNGYLLGINLQPNSTRFSLQVDYRFSDKIYMSMIWNHSLHGNNTYDSVGNLISNVGGSVFNDYNMLSHSTAPLLDGILEKDDQVAFNLQYEISYGYYLGFNYSIEKNKVGNSKSSNNYFWGTFKLDFE